MGVINPVITRQNHLLSNLVQMLEHVGQDVGRKLEVIESGPVGRFEFLHNSVTVSIFLP